MCFRRGGNRFGPATRVGDFSELLVADYIEYVLDYMVPRTRYDRKTNRNESTQGTDLIGYKMGDKPRKTDEVQLVEIKGTSDPKSKNKGMNGCKMRLMIRKRISLDMPNR